MDIKKIKYLQASESDYEQINNFFNRIYSKNRTIEKFRWEFHNAPAGKSIYIIAKEGEKVIGTQCIIPIHVTNKKGELILTGKSEDTIVDPTYRGKKIFNHMYDLLIEKCIQNGIYHIWGFTSAVKPFSRIGFQIPYDYTQSLLVNNVYKSYRYFISRDEKLRLTSKLKIFGLCLVSKTVNFFKNISSGSLKNYSFNDEKNIDKLSVLFKAIVEHTGKDFYYIEQSNEFLEWRVFNNPNYFKSHTFSLLDNDKNLVASLLLNSDENNIAFIIQSALHPDLSEKQKVTFLKKVNEKLKQNKISLIRNWNFSHTTINENENVLLKKAGFTMVNKGISFVYKLLDNKQHDFSNDFILSPISFEGTR